MRMEKDELQALETLLSTNDQYVIAREEVRTHISNVISKRTATTLHFVHG